MSSVARYEHHGPYYGGKGHHIVFFRPPPPPCFDCIFLRRCKRCIPRTNNPRRVWYGTVPSARGGRREAPDLKYIFVSIPRTNNSRRVWYGTFRCAPTRCGTRSGGSGRALESRAVGRLFRAARRAPRRTSRRQTSGARGRWVHPSVAPELLVDS